MSAEYAIMLLVLVIVFGAIGVAAVLKDDK